MCRVPRSKLVEFAIILLIQERIGGFPMDKWPLRLNHDVVDKVASVRETFLEVFAVDFIDVNTGVIYRWGASGHDV